MNRTVLLHFYPRAWRARYQDEFSELLKHLTLTPFLVFDTLRGALDAHCHPYLAQTTNRCARCAGKVVRQQFLEPLLMQLLVLVVALALNQPRSAWFFAVPRRSLGSAFMA